MTRVYLGLGTNRGDRRANLREALARLRAFVEVEATSSIYRSEPVGYRRQPDFWNLVVRGETTLPPAELLDRVKRTEREIGRRPSFRNAPRVIDIDILLYGDRSVRMPSLEIPHPRMLERAFVLRPLAELDRGLRHPVTGRTVGEHLDSARGLERTERLGAAQSVLGGRDPRSAVEGKEA